MQGEIGLGKKHGDFSGGPVVKTGSLLTGGMGSIPAQGTKIQHSHAK